MTRNITISLILLAIVALPAVAQAAGIMVNLDLTGILGCYGMGINFGNGCGMDEKMLFTTIACKVMKTIDQAVIPIYCNITLNPAYIDALNAMLVLYVCLFGVGYLVGIHRERLGVVVLGMVKMLVVYTILTNSPLFFNLIYKAVVQTPQQMVQSVLAIHGSGAQNIFQYVDESMYKIFEEVTQPNATASDRESYAAKQLSILAIAIGAKAMLPGGNFIYGLFMFVVGGWLLSYLMVVVRYLLSYLALTFMLMLAPIFIPSLLFKKTSFLFDEWLRMLISFIIEIVLVVAYVLMVEPFYKDFFNMLQKSFKNLNLEKGETRYLKPYNNSEGKEYIKEESVQDVKDPVGSMNAAGFDGDATDITSDILVNLITMAAVVFLSSAFLRYVPTLASMLAGKYNFSKLFGGEQFSQKASSAGRTNLFGQSGYAGKTDASTPDEDKAGGILGDFMKF